MFLLFESLIGKITSINTMNLNKRMRCCAIFLSYSLSFKETNISKMYVNFFPNPHSHRPIAGLYLWAFMPILALVVFTMTVLLFLSLTPCSSSICDRKLLSESLHWRFVCSAHQPVDQCVITEFYALST